MLFTPSDILSKKGHLTDLIDHSKRLQALTQKIRGFLPEYLANHCIAALWEEDKLVIHSTNSAAGTVLRYQVPKLLPLLQKDPLYASIKQIICHIRPSITNTQSPRFSSSQHSVYTISLLQSTAENISSSEVQLAMQRLATTLQNKKG